VHRVLYQQVPRERLGNGQEPAGAPGQWRTTDTPDAPAAKALPSFLRVMASSYRLEAEPDLVARVVNVAVAHYCLSWMHPFVAGNEGVSPLYSEAAVVMTGLSAEGMWSLVRGLARQASEYQRLRMGGQHRPSHCARWEKRLIVPSPAGLLLLLPAIHARGAPVHDPLAGPG